MMRASLCFLTLALASTLKQAIGASLHDAAVSSLSPITRVVELLKALSEKVEAEDKTEEGLYKEFVCWGKGVVASKTASNAEAQSRSDMLKAYIADIDAGRVEFTSERTDLEKELEQVNADLEAASQLRTQEHRDFLEAKDEMDQAIAALTDALAVLRQATTGHEQGSLLTLEHQLRAASGFTARTTEAARLSRAVELGDKFLTKGDAFFLRRVLMGSVEVPTWDWKKLNRNAGFKQSYKARSFKIQEVLAKLLQTFSDNLSEAIAKEQEAQSLHDKLSGTKLQQKNGSESALAKMEKENGARGMSKVDAQEEVDALDKQIRDDTKYIGQVSQALATKKEEWKTRKSLRAGELEAISKAIAILHSDDARNLFKRSFASQSYSLLQVRDSISSSGAASARGAVADVLSRTAASSHDRRLAVLSSRVSAQTHFDEVVAAIDTMLDLLKKEEAADLSRKEGCESNRMQDTRTAITASRSMDEMSEAIASLRADIDELTSEIAERKKSVADAQEQLDDATKLRKEEAAAHAESKKDDQEALSTVRDATTVLRNFYTDNGLMLAQQPVGRAGEAPLPPPTTWEAPYGGKTGESGGILAILTLIEEDIQKDISKADVEEAGAAALYVEVKSDLELQINDLNSEIGALETTMSGKASEVETMLGNRRTKSGELDAVMQRIKDAQSGCDYFAINYGLRLKNRQIEVDGLIKAKAILQGGEFVTPEDTSREMKPGDAFLQRRA